ncbi:MAG: hypothetical protein J6U69_02455 [Alistipes sp.]|jgi:hypothetical protein|nr:hypothetical protein [Alistipes sp.]
MIRKTSAEILSLIWDWIRTTPLYDAVPTMYLDHFPTSAASKLSGEFIVLTTLSNSIGEQQVATVNVNIYVPDTTPRINKEEQRYPDNNRLAELTKIAYDALRCYPINERYFFDILDESLISEGDIPYTFSNIKLQLKNY